MNNAEDFAHSIKSKSGYEVFAQKKIKIFIVAHLQSKVIFKFFL